MWQLDNYTPYAAARSFSRDLHGVETWIVAVKGTFVIQEDGTTRLAEKQEPVTVAPTYLGEPGRSSLYADTDLVIAKPGTDVLIHGHAYAPQGQPITQLTVELHCGPLAKRLVISGDRTYRRRGAKIVPSQPEPFVSMPICYERAFGGVDPENTQIIDERNPVGTGFSTHAEHLLGRLVPNIERPDALITSAYDRPEAAGFGPLGRHWLPRRMWAGTYDNAWRQERMPLLPEDFNERFFSAAPDDQQVAGYLPGGALMELRHLTPAGLLCFRLPKIFLCLRTSFGGRAVEHRPRLHTVLITPDVGTVSLVWCSALPCQGSEHRLESTRITEKAYV